jgi:hypothetical protein
MATQMQQKAEVWAAEAWEEEGLKELNQHHIIITRNIGKH